MLRAVNAALVVALHHEAGDASRARPEQRAGDEAEGERSHHGADGETREQAAEHSGPEQERHASKPNRETT